MFLLLADLNTHFVQAVRKFSERESATPVRIKLVEEVLYEGVERLELLCALSDSPKQVISVDLRVMVVPAVSRVQEESMEYLIARDNSITVDIEVLH
jgi:hypothetical protein